MLTTYKEIVYGAAFGFIALVLDTAMDAKSAGQSFLAELGTHPGMMLYRLLFLFFGIFLGWLLWRNNQRERDMRGEYGIQIGKLRWGGAGRVSESEQTTNNYRHRDDKADPVAEDKKSRGSTLHRMRIRMVKL